jgi:arylsulfatase A-like enzyme
MLSLPWLGCVFFSNARPSFIVIVIDTLRDDHLGSYGFPGDISPRLDQLASESVLFENCFAQAPWTPPSMGSLFTSLYPEVHGLNVFRDQQFRDPDSGEMRIGVLPDSAVTLAERLRDAGYETVAFVTNPWLQRPMGLAQGFERYDDEDTGRRVTANAIAAPLRRWLETRRDERPFFAYLHFMDVHGPWDAPKPDFDALRDHVATEERRLIDSELPSEAIEARPIWADEGMRHEVGYWRTRYASGVRAFDRRLAPYLKYLRDSGILDQSYVIVTSDHGEELFENGGWGHGRSLHEHQLRVPLLVRKPGGADGGRRVSEMIGLIDLMPTILSLARAAAPEGIHGHDVSALLDGKPVERPALFYATGTMWEPQAHSVRTRRHKLIVNRATGLTRLFDLASDPDEREDLSGQESQLLGVMQELLNTHLSTGSESKLDTQTGKIEAGTLEKLKSLGYLD